MRVLMVTQFYPPVVGGQEQHVRNLAQALAERGHHVEVATTAVDGRVTSVNDGQVLVHRLHAASQYLPFLYEDPGRPHALPVVDPQFRAGIGRLLGAGHFDVVHGHDWAVNSAIGPARKRGIPMALTQHDYSHVCATKRFMRGGEVCPGPSPVACIRCASSKHGAVVGPGVVVANALSWQSRTRRVATFVPVSSVVAVNTGLPGRSRYEVIPNFVPDDLLVRDAVPQPGGPVLFVGDLTRDKGIEVLIAAHRRLDDAPHLVLAGRVLDDTPLGLPDRVELAGLLDHGAVMALMRTASIVVVPSIVPDCCPTVVLEAMAAGRPVIASASGGIVDLVEDGVTGMLVTPGDAAALATALTSMMADRIASEAMGRRGLDRVRLFTASAVVGRVEHLYERLIAGGRPLGDSR